MYCEEVQDRETLLDDMFMDMFIDKGRLWSWKREQCTGKWWEQREQWWQTLCRMFQGC